MSRIYTDEAELYDIAFDWDLSEEAAWLIERLGPGCRNVLEPGCGSGRMLAALSVHGLEAVGIDTSVEMLALARGRGCEAVRADMTNFDLGRRFDNLSAFWTVEAWRKAIAASPFTQVASHDDEVEVELDDGGGLLWHELVAP